MDNASFKWPTGGDWAADWRADPERRAAFERVAELRRKPLVAVLDTSCVRTGLAHQLKNGLPPASLSTVQDGTIRLFMERDTLDETCEKLPVFAKQLGIPTSELVRMFADDWLPYIGVVALPPGLRQLDQRALAVRDLDPDDYPTAALAALLSPCVFLTHNYKHFRPLGIREPSQGVKAVIAAIDIKVGESRLQAAATVPAVPVAAIGAGTKWAADRVGPVVWLILGLLVLGGFAIYQRQPPERKEAIKKVAGEVGYALLEEAAQATTSVQQARQVLGTYVVPAAQERTPTAAAFRELAMSSGPMSAQQLCDALDDPVRPTVASLRAFLHANKGTVFDEVRRGSFILGKPYALE